MNDYDIIIAGGGVAGLSAALFLGRAGLSVALFDEAESSLYRVSRVNNYLGFPDGIPGTELLELGTRQAKRFGATIHSARIERALPCENGFIVQSGGQEYACARLILASNKRTDLATALGIPLGGHGGHGGRFVAVDAEGRTSVPNCYAVGRITGLPSQAIISAGDGAKTAIAIIQQVRGTYYVDHDV